MKGISTPASKESTDAQNLSTDPENSGGQATPDTAFDTSRKPWTPGPWRWEFNKEYRKLSLCGGAKRFDLTVIDFVRWGMGGATMRLRDLAHDGMNLLYKVHEREDWLSVQPGREHHKHWHMLVNHPDARLIEASPDFADGAEDFVAYEEAIARDDQIAALVHYADASRKLRAALAKAQGGSNG